jgi:tryptophan synthase alpha chain
MGPDAFAHQAAEAGADGVLVTDLPPAEAGEWVGTMKSQGLQSVFLVAPSSTPERVELASRLTTGFVYCVSRPGVTGVRDELPAEVADLVGRIRGTTEKPVAVGFGISRAEHVREVCRTADGAIVGSAMVRTIGEADSRQAAVEAAVAFTRALGVGKEHAA